MSNDIVMRNAMETIKHNILSGIHYKINREVELWVLKDKKVNEILAKLNPDKGVVSISEACHLWGEASLAVHEAMKSFPVQAKEAK
jgi:hypothetical protein